MILESRIEQTDIGSDQRKGTQILLIYLMNSLNDKDTQHESRIEQQATGRKEAVRLIHTAAKLKTKFDNYEMS